MDRERCCQIAEGSPHTRWLSIPVWKQVCVHGHRKRRARKKKGDGWKRSYRSTASLGGFEISQCWRWGNGRLIAQRYLAGAEVSPSEKGHRTYTEFGICVERLCQSQSLSPSPLPHLRNTIPPCLERPQHWQLVDSMLISLWSQEGTGLPWC